MNQLLTRLLQYTGEQINRNESYRAAFICWMAFPVYLLLVTWSLATLWFGFHPGIENNSLRVLASWSAITGLFYFCFGAYQWFFRQDREHSNVYTYMVLVFYAVTTMITCFMVGPTNIITGVVLMNATLIGMMLFPVNLVLALVALCALTILTLAFLNHANLLPFTPMLDGKPTLYATTVSIVAATAYIIYETVIMASLVKAWRSRELGIKELSLTDPLTGVANRRQILDLLEIEFADRRGEGHHLSVIMADIDHFKQINDSHGHQVGDRVLQLAAKAMHDCLRQDDHIGRYGGEEFLILLPGTSLPQAMHIAQRCCDAIARLRLADIPELTLTASLGVASHTRQQNGDTDKLIRQADDAMYEAKKQGRNRVVSSSASSSR